jgi:hypothetical protein
LQKSSQHFAVKITLKGFFLVFRGCHFLLSSVFSLVFRDYMVFLITMRRTWLAVCITLFFWVWENSSSRFEQMWRFLLAILSIHASKLLRAFLCMHNVQECVLSVRFCTVWKYTTMCKCCGIIQTLNLFFWKPPVV